MSGMLRLRMSEQLGRDMCIYVFYDLYYFGRSFDTGCAILGKWDRGIDVGGIQQIRNAISGNLRQIQWVIPHNRSENQYSCPSF